MTDSVTLIGGERLMATMANAARQLADMGSVNGQVGEVVRARASSNAPKRTGRLAGSVRASTTATEVVVSSGLAYARRVNYGAPSVGQPAQPFMTDALRDTESANVEMYDRRVKTVVSTIKGA